MIMKAFIVLLIASFLKADVDNGVWISEEIKDPNCFYENDYNWLYIRAFTSTGMVDKSARQNLISTKEAVPNRRIYVMPTVKVEAATMMKKVCEEVIQGLEEKFHVYVAVYSDPVNWFPDKAQNRAYLEKILESMKAQPDCFKTINIISRKFDWESVLGADYSEFSAHVLIWDKTSDKVCSRDGYIPFGGWKLPDGVVFNHLVDVCENKCDVSCLYMGLGVTEEGSKEED